MNIFDGSRPSKDTVGRIEMSAVAKFFKRNRVLKYGAPFICLVVGGPFVLKQFGQVRYKYSQKTVDPKEEAELNKMKAKQDVTIEDVYEDVKNMDIEHWEQVRGPRPWEEQPHQPSSTKTVKSKT